MLECYLYKSHVIQMDFFLLRNNSYGLKWPVSEHNAKCDNKTLIAKKRYIMINFTNEKEINVITTKILRILSIDIIGN